VADTVRIDELERRVARDPASPAFAQLAEEYRRDGRLGDAVRVCRTGLISHPAYLSARVTLGRALMSLEQLDDAHAEFQAVIRETPDNVIALRALAELHQRYAERGQLPPETPAPEWALDAIDPGRAMPIEPLEPGAPQFDVEAVLLAPQPLSPFDLDMALRVFDDLALAEMPGAANRSARVIAGDALDGAEVLDSPELAVLERWLDATLADRARRKSRVGNPQAGE
jgi:tetratricopeptide (TPR) repeat protein